MGFLAYTPKDQKAEALRRWTSKFRNH